MLQLRNRSGLPVALFSVPDADGVEALHVVAQLTFALTPEAPRAAAQRPIDRVDVREGGGARAWLRRASVVHTPRPFTDVLLEAEAVAPGGRAVTALDVGVEVGPLRRALRVFGARRYTGREAPFCTAPEAFTRVPLTPDRAFGGAGDPRNPAGVGLVASGDLAAARGLALPEVEDPASPLTRAGALPEPALVTPVAPSWQPRASLAGTYDAAWERTRAPFLPADFDPAFAQAAPRAMWVRPGLQGAEPITLTHLAEAPRVESRVPSLALRVGALFRGREVALPARIEALQLFPGDGVATVLYRATLRCGHRLLEVAGVTVDAEGGA